GIVVISLRSSGFSVVDSVTEGDGTSVCGAVVVVSMSDCASIVELSTGCKVVNSPGTNVVPSIARKPGVISVVVSSNLISVKSFSVTTCNCRGDSVLCCALLTGDSVP